MKTRIEQNEPNDPAPGEPSVTPTMRSERKFSDNSDQRVSSIRASP